MTWMLRRMTLEKKDNLGPHQGAVQYEGFGSGRIHCTISRSRSVAPTFELKQKKPVLLLPYVFECLERDCRRFTWGTSAPTYWVTSFLTAALETKRSNKHCSRHTAFLPSAASMQIRALELFFVSSLRLLLLATLCKNEEDGAEFESVLMEEFGGGVSKQSFWMIQLSVPYCYTINKQLKCK